MSEPQSQTETNIPHYIQKSFSLSITLARAGFTLRHEGTYLGVLWYLLNPLLLFALLFFIFSYHLGSDIEHYPLYLLLGIIMFNFFQQATTEATRIIEQQKWIIKSINFPREAIPLSVTLKALYSHGFEIAVLALFMVALSVSPWGIVAYIPILLCFSLFVLGCALIMAAMTVYVADIEPAWVFGSRLLFFATPIFYAADVQGQLLFVHIFNPLYYYMTAAREVVIYGQLPEMWIVWGVVGYTVVACGIGFWVFGRLKRKFAELI